MIGNETIAVSLKDIRSRAAVSQRLKGCRSIDARKLSRRPTSHVGESNLDFAAQRQGCDGCSRRAVLTTRKHRKDIVADREYSRYQQKVIQRFYDNREQNDEQRLSDMIADLFLANDKKKAKLWEQAEEIMQRLGVPAARLAHVMKQRDPTVLAGVVEDIRAGHIKPPKKERPSPPKSE